MSRRKRKVLKLAIDLGASVAKAIGSVGDSSLPLIFPSQAIEVADPSYLKDGNDYDILDCCWIGIDENRYMALGQLAISLGAVQPFRHLKSVYATHKILAAAVIFADRFDLGTNFDLEVGCLLPPGEFADRDLVGTELKRALIGFDSAKGRFGIDLVGLHLFPEGMGTVKLYFRHRPQTQKLAAIVTGHRNFSCYIFHGGRAARKSTSDLGFRRWADQILERTSGYTLEELTDVVPKYWLDRHKDPHGTALLSILKRTGKDGEQELERTIEAIESAYTFYWMSVKSWLDEALDDVEEVMISGGTGLVLKQELIEYLLPKLPVRPDCGNRPGIFNDLAFKLPQLNVAAEYQSRMADVYCLWAYLM